MITAWLKDRIEKLYETHGEDVAAEVLAVAQAIYSKAAEISPAGGSAELANALTQALRQFTGYSSAAGRIARMEIAHLVEALKLLTALHTPHQFASIAGPSIVPVTTIKVETDMATASGNNADAVTSTSTLQNAEGMDYGKLGAAPTTPLDHFADARAAWDKIKAA